MKRIVIIDNEPYTKRRDEIFYVSALIERGFEVQFWDCSQFFNPGITITDTLEKPYVSYINNLSNLESLLSKTDIENSTFIVEVAMRWANRKFLRLLAQHKCKMVRQEMFAPTTSPNQIPLLTKLKQATPTEILIVLKRRVEGILFRLYARKHKIHYSVRISSDSLNITDININHPDWERSQSIIEQKLPSPDRFALFLDQYFPLHPDFFKYQHKMSSSDTYQQQMRTFFDRFEQENNMTIVIAAHPKSEYSQGVFGNRKIIKYQTESLVESSQIVIMHGSSSISYAIIFNKPIILVNTPDYKKFRVLIQYQNRISTKFKLQIHTIDNNEDRALPQPEYVPKEIREEYIYNFLTTKKIQNLKNIDILSKAFSEI